MVSLINIVLRATQYVQKRPLGCIFQRPRCQPLYALLCQGKERIRSVRDPHHGYCPNEKSKPAYPSEILPQRPISGRKTRNTTPPVEKDKLQRLC